MAKHAISSVSIKQADNGGFVVRVSYREEPGKGKVPSVYPPDDTLVFPDAKSMSDHLVGKVFPPITSTTAGGKTKSTIGGGSRLDTYER